MNSETSETNLVIVTKKHRALLFSKLYWRTLIVIITPLLLLPIACIGENHAYLSFYLFLVTGVYWVTDALHPAIISIVPVALYSIIGPDYITEVIICNELLDCLGVMMLMACVENSRVHHRLALKLLTAVGCSHYRLSLVLFFSAMFLSMWIPNTVTCGLVLPVVKALLQALEKMGIIEVYETIESTEKKAHKHEMSVPKPTDITVFYYLGIAYSCSIGGMATLHGSQANQIFKEYCEVLFPNLPEMTFPRFMLLTLPGVLATETLLYIWMNSFFLKIFKLRANTAIPTSLNEEEHRYIGALLRKQYADLGGINFHDMAVAGSVLLLVALQVGTSSVRLTMGSTKHMHVRVSSPSIFCVLLLFVIPTDFKHLKFFKRRIDALTNPLPTAPSKGCLNWVLVRDHVMWSVLFTIVGSCMAFESLKNSGMTEEFGKFLLLLQDLPSPVIALLVILFCKVLTEFASNSCVVYVLLPEVAKLCTKTNMHPHFLLLVATLSSSMSAHLMPSTPGMAMVSQYVHIPAWRMMEAGIGPSTIAVLVTWFTATLWSKVILPESI